MTRMKPLAHKPMGQKVADAIRDWILSGHLPAGGYIRQEEIAKELGVSRLPVREALTILESEGLVYRETYKGTVVAEVSIEEVKEAYALRVLLETYLLENAITHITDEDLERAEAIVARSNKCENDEEWAALNADFHLAIYAPANLPFTLQTLEHVLRKTDRYFRLQRAMSPTLRESSTEQHLEIVNQIRAKNPHGAIDALKRHIAWNSDEVSGVISKSLSVGNADDR